MPFGLPFIARPGQEGFDAYGRMCKSSQVCQKRVLILMYAQYRQSCQRVRSLHLVPVIRLTACRMGRMGSTDCPGRNTSSRRCTTQRPSTRRRTSSWSTWTRRYRPSRPWCKWTNGTSRYSRYAIDKRANDRYDGYGNGDWNRYESSRTVRRLEKLLYPSNPSSHLDHSLPLSLSLCAHAFESQTFTLRFVGLNVSNDLQLSPIRIIDMTISRLFHYLVTP